MVDRDFWKKVIERAWSDKPIIWLTGVRRVGKTCLCQSLNDIVYFDCELPRHRRLMEDPEEFLNNLKGKRIVLDEIHRLQDPSELLKIAADHFPAIKIIATGSSILGASIKFRDTLAGRKRQIWMTPMVSEDLSAFDDNDIRKRLLFGGMPSFYLSENLPEHDYHEWADAYWAKDIQALFNIQKRGPFLKFFELLMTRSGSMFEATKYTAPCEVSRSTINNYLKIFEETFVTSVIRPFSSHKPTEIVSAPKVYGFDTGFVCFYKGWSTLRQEDLGDLWEHYVLNEIQGSTQSPRIAYWRDKTGHEIDFIIPKRSGKIIAIECKWSEKSFDFKTFKVFSKFYPSAQLVVVCQDVDMPFTRKIQDKTVRFTSLTNLREIL